MGLRGLSRLTCVCVFQSDLSTPIRVSLIVVPDTVAAGSKAVLVPPSVRGGRRPPVGHHAGEAREAWLKMSMR